MDFKKKAGLALALAAIFTVGASPLALAAENNTASSGGDIVVGTGGSKAPLEVTGGGATPSVDLQSANATVTEVLVDNAATSFTINGTKELTLTGTGTELVQTDGGKVVPVKTTTQLNLAGGSGQLSSTLTISGADGGLGVADGAYGINIIKGDNAGNLIEVAGSAVGKTATLNVGALDLTGITLSTPVTVGDAATGNGILSIDKAALGGNVIFADPPFKAEDFNPSEVNIQAFSGTLTTGGDYINGKLIGSQNSIFTIGASDSEFIRKAIADTGMWNSLIKTQGQVGYTAAMAFVGPQTLESLQGGILVSGGIDAAGTNKALSNASVTPNTITFADNSLAAFDLTGVSDTVAALSSYITAQTKAGPIAAVTIGTTAAPVGAASTNDAGVYFHNARSTEGKAGLVIFDNVTTLTVNNAAVSTLLDKAGAATAMGDHWTGDNLHFSSRLLDGYWTVTKDTVNSTYDMVLNVTRSTEEVQDLYPRMSNGMAGMVDGLYRAGLNSSAWFAEDDAPTVVGIAETDNAGILFVSRATDDDFLGELDPTLAAATLEGAAQIAVAAGVPAVTGNVIAKISSLVVDHNNLLNATQPAYGNEPGSFGIWANPFYAMSDVDGMDAGRFESGYEMNYGGAAFGIDYNINEAFRLGLALNVGGGDTDNDGNGDFNQTDADFDFFGVSLYGSYTNGAFGLTADLGFTGVDYEIDQRIPGELQMGTLESDVDSNAFTLGLTGQYRFAAGENLNITPHLGLRYTQINIDDSYVNSRGYGRVFDVETEDQNLFQIPLGVEFSSNIVTDGGWTITPSADLGVLFTTGDNDVETRVRIPGTNLSTGAMSADVTDSAAFQGRLGIKAAADNGLSLGLDYGILASGNQTDHQFSGMLRFEF